MTIDEILTYVFTLTAWDYVLLSALLILFAYQLYFIIRYLGGVARKAKSQFAAPSAAESAAKPGVTVVISARNEGYNLEHYLQAVLTQDYPEFEVFVVDDGSGDDTADVIERYKNEYLNLRSTFVPKGARVSSTKKLALTMAAKSAKYEYLLLTDSMYDDPVEGLKAIMSPPLRKDQDREELWQALKDGVIDTVATDHCPFHFRAGKAEKQYGKNDFTKCPNGAPGVQERLMLMFSEGFMKGRLTLPEVVKYTSSNPCRMFGLYPEKGSFEPGTDADIVIVDPGAVTEVNGDYIRGASDYSCYEGMKLQGRISRVLLRGEEIVNDGEFLGKRGDGKYLKRGTSILAGR